MQAPERADPGGELAELKSRVNALRQAASLPEAAPKVLLDAALAELDGAIEGLAEGEDQGDATGDSRALSGLHSERRLLQAIFNATPVPLYIVDHDGTVLRANAAAASLLGAGVGYATGKSLAALLEPGARAAIRSQLAAVARTGQPVRLNYGILAQTGVVRAELTIESVSVRGDADRLLVAVNDHAGAEPTVIHADEPGQDGSDPGSAALADAARRLDLLTAATRLLLESASVSESALLQRCARLLSGSLTTWAVVDVYRRGQLRRHYVAGPDDPESASLAHATVATEPGPGSVPDLVCESGQTLLLTHIDDDSGLGAGTDGLPLLTRLGAVSLVSVPMRDETHRYGVLTLVRRADDGQFGLADAALAEEIGALLGRAISGRRMLRQRSEAADALRASLLPPVLKPVPGVEISCAHLAPTRGREVGGDFYDVYPTPGGWGLAIGDVCGKGEDAAAATAAARHAIRVLAYSNGDPAEVLRGANDIMLAEEFGGRFVTASAAHLGWHGSTLRVVLATAGHPGPVLVDRDGRAQLVPGGGVALGIFPDPEPATLELELTDGDVLFFYTDGLAEVRGPEAANFEDSLADTLAMLAGRHAAELVSDMQKAVLDFCHNALRDDLTMLVLRAGIPPDR
jgi:serine phosphatase RsbU (regulator of sigma subunit)/PAS domain-containing protein